MKPHHARMPGRCTLGLLALLAAAWPARADPDGQPEFTLGACGGAMTGYDGRQYACDRDRKPACEASSGSRCRCLERRDCGGQRDEPF